MWEKRKRQWKQEEGEGNMAKSKNKKQIKTKRKFINDIDTTIQGVCKKLNADAVYGENYAETVTALAELVKARALLH